MCYRCNVCERVVPPGRGRLVHTVYRIASGPARLLATRSSPIAHDTVTVRPPRQEIARELLVCGSCKVALDGGTPLSELRERVRRRQEEQQLLNGQHQLEAAPGLPRCVSQPVRSPEPEPTPEDPPALSPGEEVSECSADPFAERARQGVKDLLAGTRVGRYGKVILQEKEYVNGHWQGGQTLSFKKTGAGRVKFGALAPMDLEAAVDFVMDHLRGA